MHEELTANSQPRVAVVIDTPNLTISIAKRFGAAARPDYRWLLRRAERLGSITSAVALVNQGVPVGFSGHLRAIGYKVENSHAFDCDDSVIAWCVRLHATCDCMMICGGDHTYCDVVQLLKEMKKKIVICSAKGTCNAYLQSLGDEFLEVPAFLPRPHLENRRGYIN